ncbi:MAG: hypothetical protein HYT11_02020 [Candidatus Levybacteria bacterium]|nr:hypothetical protein [Candidatus Levybacteria bacterium]
MSIELRYSQRGVVVPIETFSPGETRYFSLDNYDTKTVRMFRIRVNPDNQSAEVGRANDVPLFVTADPLRAEEIIYEDQGVVVADMPYTVPLIEGTEDSPIVSIEHSLLSKKSSNSA